MGVNGLWTVIQPCARPTNLATLNRKRLAVDASIWIYQFLKAVRDKEGNALRNSHVVGFFRRICKLLWFGIQPVFVFDGGAPALKRATIQGRQRRREGRREDAVRTAGKLLAVQMKRLADEEEEKRKREADRGVRAREEAAQQEEIPDANQLVYVDEIGMSQRERQQTRKFFKQDAYHLPELDGSIANMGKPEDPRIMSLEELEDYAKQFHSGEDVNLYDFSKIDFDGDFFKSLPPADRYNILNAARLRSRLRLGFSKEQLDDMFPDRMAFSRFQIERVKERNNLTQRLMAEAGMTGIDLTINGSARIAGEKDREYILVKNEGAEGGWALGVVSKEKDVGEEHKPIDVDAIEIQYQSKDAVEEEEDADDFEDIPVEGLNRLPRAPRTDVDRSQAHQESVFKKHGAIYEDRSLAAPQPANMEGSLFVGGDAGNAAIHSADQEASALQSDEQDDIDRAIAMSLKNQHSLHDVPEEEEIEFEDVPTAAPEWEQKAVEAAKPIKTVPGSGRSMIAHIVNNRANAAVAKRQDSRPTATSSGKQQDGGLESDSDSEDDMQAILAKSRKMKANNPAPRFENKKNPFDGPLPFPKLDWGASLFKNGTAKPASESGQQKAARDVLPADADDDVDDTAGGFELLHDEDAPRPLPPWLANDTDIREDFQRNKEKGKEIDAEDRMEAEEEERKLRRQMRDRMIEVESSSDDASDVEVIDRLPSPAAKQATEGFTLELPEETMVQSTPDPVHVQEPQALEEETSVQGRFASPSPELEFEDVKAPSPKAPATPEEAFEEVPLPGPSDAGSDQPEPAVTFSAMTQTALEATANDNFASAQGNEEDDLFDDVEYDEFSDPGDEELMAQMAEEADEHARFASELNNKSAEQNREDYEKELRQLRNQQKKDRRDADEVTQVMITECQSLLRLFGIPYITAPMEAEAQCAELVSLGLVDGVVTDDSDIFLFGGTRVYKNMFNSNKFVECYLGGDLEKELSLSREQLISLAHLLGSDYTEGLPGVGPVTAVEILSEFPGRSGLEHFRDWWKDVQSQARPREADATSSFRKKFRKSQGAKLFLAPGFPNAAVYDAYLHPEVDDNTEAFQWGVPDVEGLRRFLMATIGWSKERTDEVLVPVIKDMNKRDIEGTQSNITRFFGGSVGVGAKEAFAPRQKGQGSKRMAAAVDRLRANVTSDGANEGAGTGNKRRRTERRTGVAEDAEDERVDDV